MVGFVDETYRDGPQSLWATRMKTETMLGATQWMNRAGFRKICVTSGAAFETAVKFLRDDPWERMRLLKAGMPDSSIDVLMRSRNLFGWARYPDEVVEVLFRCLQAAGTEWIKVFDGLNCMRNIAAHFRIARNLGLKTSGMLSFSVSPVHTDEHYIDKAMELISYGVDSITLADPAGILTGARTRVLLAALKAAVPGRVPIEFIAHDCMGLAHAAHREALQAGVDTVATASAPLANGESVPSTLDILELAQKLGVPAALDADALRRTDEYFGWIAWKERRPVPERVVFDPVRYDRFIGHQIPGGMMSNFRNQLKEVGLTHRMDEVLEEASRVRAELGYPIMVTPFSQFVGVQAAFNVIQGERYKTVPEELTLYATGHYGEPAVPIDRNVLDRILAGRHCVPADPDAGFGARILENFKREQGPFRSDEDMLLHLFYGREHVEALAREKSTFSGRLSIKRPLCILIEELARDASLRTVKLEKGPLKLSLRFARPAGPDRTARGLPPE
ncbi:MAG: pyruvate carboxylase [Betaproteobacteria bacterium]|nr:pyruvate carboxylase [Betaproteobacteria bacterium]